MRGRRGRVAVLAAAVTLVAVLLVPGQAFAAKLALSSGSFKFEASAGETVKGSITVINDGDEPMKVLVYSADQDVDSKGKVTFSVPSRADLTSIDLPSAWVRIAMPADAKAVGNIPYLELAPKQRVPIDFSVKLPADAAPGDHNVMLFFEMFSGETISQGAGTSISGRIGTRVQLRVKGEVVERLEVSRFPVPTFLVGNALPVDFTLRNLGNVDQRVVASVKLLDRADDPLSEIKPINNRLVFAQKNHEATGTIVTSKTLFGQYTARLEVTPVDEDGKPVGGGKNVVIEKRTLWIVPQWALIAAGALLVGILLWLVWQAGRLSAGRRQRKQMAAAEAAAQQEAPRESA